jgi:hypothetical protein
MNAADFRELVYSTYGGIPKTPEHVQRALAHLERMHGDGCAPEKVWYERLAEAVGR